MKVCWVIHLLFQEVAASGRPESYWWAVGPAFTLFIHLLLFLPSSSVSFSYFILTFPMLTCSGKHSYTSPIAMLNRTLFFHETSLQRSKIRYSNNNLIMQLGTIGQSHSSAILTTLFRARFTSFHFMMYSSYLLLLFRCLISLLLFPCANICWNTPAWVTHFLLYPSWIVYGYTIRSLLWPQLRISKTN